MFQLLYYSNMCLILLICFYVLGLDIKYILLSFGAIYFDKTNLLFYLCITIANIQPVFAAESAKKPFCDISFKNFNKFIVSNFNSEISLGTVLLVLFSLTENPDLLNLHAKRKHPNRGEVTSTLNGWIIAFASAVHAKLDHNINQLFQLNINADSNKQQLIKDTASKLDELAEVLELTPYRKKKFQAKLKPMSYDNIRGVHLICPHTMTCTTASCKKQGLAQATKERDIPKSTLIQGISIYKNVSVLTGQCMKCSVLYTADHETTGTSDAKKRFYCNDATFLKIGQNLWVDRVFAASIINATYHFHASPSAIAEFWSTSYGEKVTRRHIWATFVQESTRVLSNACKIDFEVDDKLSIENVTTSAYNILGGEGCIQAAMEHTCEKCTQPYKSTADIIPGAHTDPAAVVDNDEGEDVPGLEQIPEHIADNVAHNPNVDAMEVDAAPVKMIVLDGIVMGPTHCAFENCCAKLSNARGGAFCDFHEGEYGLRCRVVDCHAIKLANTQACENHQNGKNISKIIAQVHFQV